MFFDRCYCNFCILLKLRSVEKVVNARIKIFDSFLKVEFFKNRNMIYILQS